MAKKLKLSDGEVVEIKGKEVLESTFSGSVKSVDKDKRILSIVGSTEDKDRDGDVISVSGWDLTNYRKNPVFLWAHDYWSVPIGAASKVVQKRVPFPHLEFQIRFPTEGLYPFADMIFELYKEKIINASSVGFLPTKWEPLKDEEEGRTKFLKQELLELSGVPVPSNPAALQNFLGGKGGGTPSKMAEMLTGYDIPRPEREDDLLGELEVRNFQVDIPKEERPIWIPVEEDIGVKGEEGVDEEKEKGYIADIGKEFDILTEKLFGEIEKRINCFFEELEEKIDRAFEQILEKSKESCVEATIPKELYTSLLGFKDKRKEPINTAALDEALDTLKSAVKRLKG